MMGFCNGFACCGPHNPDWSLVSFSLGYCDLVHFCFFPISYDFGDLLAFLLGQTFSDGFGGFFVIHGQLLVLVTCWVIFSTSGGRFGG